VKVFVLVPLLGVVLLAAPGSGGRYAATLLFCTVGLVDYLTTISTRSRGPVSRRQKVFDRLTDYPLLFLIALAAVDHVHAGLILAKICVDVLLLVCLFNRFGPQSNRLRTGMNYAVLLLLMFLGQGVRLKITTPAFVSALLHLNIVLSGAAVLYSVGVLQKRFLADALSMGNLMCGLLSMQAARYGRFEWCLLFILGGAALDGFDGWAARKYGGTRFGVYSDDIADAVNYGIAPGVALYLFSRSVEGAVLGVFFTVFTISRLVYFTLNKDNSDPNYFSGVPSTVGGIIVLCSLSLFRDQRLLIGLMTGVACIQMVSFDTHYRHLGRALAAHRRAFYYMPAYLFLLIAGAVLWGMRVPIAIILTANLSYALLPTVLHMARAARHAGADRGRRPGPDPEREAGVP